MVEDAEGEGRAVADNLFICEDAWLEQIDCDFGVWLTILGGSVHKRTSRGGKEKERERQSRGKGRMYI